MALPVPKTLPRGGNLFETIISALVILVAIGFMVFFVNRTSTGHLGSYDLEVNLVDASGLSIGSEVRLAGVKVGSVTGLALEPVSYRAVVDIRIRDDLSLPADSRAAVSSSALGGLYLAIVPGRSAATLGEGSTIGLPAPAHKAKSS